MLERYFFLCYVLFLWKEFVCLCGQPEYTMSKKTKLSTIFLSGHGFMVIMSEFGCNVIPQITRKGEDTVHVKCDYEDGTTREFYILASQLMEYLRAGLNSVKFKDEFYKEAEKI
jgi:hypothetical protein